MLNKMLDELIMGLAHLIAQYVKPTIMLKLAIVAIIVALPVSWLLGGWVFDVVATVVLCLTLTNEFLYAKVAEDQSKTSVEPTASPE